MSLFPDEDILTKEIETWRGFIEKLHNEDKLVLTKLLNDYYKYSVAINNHAQTHPFPFGVINYVSVTNSTQTHRSVKVDDTIGKQAAKVSS